MVGTEVKANIGELEEEVMEGCSRRMRKELTDVIQGISENKRFLVRFQDGCKNNLSSNQPTIVIVEKILEEKKPEVFMNTEIPEEKVTLGKGYYFCVYFMLRFKKEVGIERKGEQVDVEDDTDNEEMEDVKLDDGRERHWRIFFEDNGGGVDDKKVLLHAKRWDAYVNEKEKLIKGGYLVEVVVSDRKKVHQEVVDNHVVEEETDHDEIGLREFNFNFFDEDEKRVVREESSEFPHLLTLIKICHGDWNTQFKRMNLKVDEENGKEMGMGNGRY